MPHARLIMLFCKRNEASRVVSKDDDFVILASRLDDCGRLIWVRIGNARKLHLIASFDRARDSIVEFVQSNRWVLELR
jgi:predicted nuclease of predicted toxin-antitoxin system